MNATPSININLVNPAQTKSSGKPQDAAADVPFKQVLSSEIAHKRSENSSKGRTDINADSSDFSTKPETLKTDADTTAQEAQTTAFPVMPEALLALAIPPDTQNAVPTSDDTAIDQPLSLDTDTSTSGRKSRATRLQAGQLTAQTPDAQKSGAMPGDKTIFQIAAQAATEVTAQAQMGTNLTIQAQAAAAKAAQTHAMSSAKAFAAQSATTTQAQDTSPDADFSAQVATTADAKNISVTAFAAQAATVPAAQSQATPPTSAIAGQLAIAHQADTLKVKELPVELMGHTAQHPVTQASFNLPGVNPLKSNTLAPSVGTSAWSQALGDKVVWMAAGAQQTASLTLNPPNMGPLQIVLNITNDQATASFFSAQPEVRQALEAAFPKLREMMNEAGIQLGQATVSAENPRQNEASDRQAQRPTAPFNVTDDGVAAGQVSPQAVIQHSGRGLVDTFA